MKNSILLKKYYFLIYSTVSPLPLFNIKHIQKYIPLIKIISIVFISSIVVKAQESIGVFSVIENTTNGVPTTSSTSNFDLYTDRIIIYDKKIVEFPLTDFIKDISDNKVSTFSFTFNSASCVLRIYKGEEYNLTITTKKKVETFKGYVSGFNASIQSGSVYSADGGSITPPHIEEDQVLDLTPITPLVGEPKSSPEQTSLKSFNEYFKNIKQDTKPVISISEADLGQYAGKYLPTASLERYLKGDKTLDAEFVLTENENVKKKSVALAIIGLIIIGVTIFMFNQNKESLGQADSKIKSIDENELKANLNTNNLDNSRIAEIDDNTLKQKLGL